jgi:peptide/nickel transport system permease protein
MSDIELSVAPSGAPGGAPILKRGSAAKVFLKRLIKEKKLGTVGALITLLLLLTGIFADVIAPYGMNETYVGDQLSEPSNEHLFGTDDIGRDVFSRVIHGARVSVIVGLSAAIISTSLSLLIGVSSGYMGGKLDLLVQRGVDIWISLPGLVILLIIVAIVGTGLVPMIVILSLFYGVPGSRIVRGAVIAVKENAYIAASRAVGCSTMRILLRHILPNILPTALVLFTIRVPAIILAEAGLSFLGFGLPPPTPSWGGMISGAGRTYMFQAPWMVLWPGVALALVVYGINMFGDALRDLVDPRLRGGSGRYGVKVKKAVEADLEPERAEEASKEAGAGD